MDRHRAEGAYMGSHIGFLAVSWISIVGATGSTLHMHFRSGMFPAMIQAICEDHAAGGNPEGHELVRSPPWHQIAELPSAGLQYAFPLWAADPSRAESSRPVRSSNFRSFDLGGGDFGNLNLELLLRDFGCWPLLWGVSIWESQPCALPAFVIPGTLGTLRSPWVKLPRLSFAVAENGVSQFHHRSGDFVLSHCEESLRAVGHTSGRESCTALYKSGRKRRGTAPVTLLLKSFWGEIVTFSTLLANAGALTRCETKSRAAGTERRRRQTSSAGNSPEMGTTNTTIVFLRWLN